MSGVEVALVHHLDRIRLQCGAQPILDVEPSIHRRQL